MTKERTDDELLDEMYHVARNEEYWGTPLVHHIRVELSNRFRALRARIAELEGQVKV